MAAVTWDSQIVTWDSLLVTWGGLAVPAPHDPPVTVKVWRKLTVGWGQVGEIRGWHSLEVEARHNAPGTWSMLLPFDAQTERITKTRLLTFDYRGERFTGLVERVGPRSDEHGKPVLEVSGVGTLALLGDTMCYPDPGSAASAQLTTRYRVTGTTETVLRNLILANVVTRRGDELTIPASLGRGGTVTVNEFFSNLLVTVQQKADVRGLGVRMGLVDTTSSTRAAMTLSFYAPADRSNRVRLSHRVGTLRSWSQDDAAPTLTRAVVAGAVEDTPRPVSSVNATTDILTLTGTDARHNLKTGSRIKFVKGTPPDPLDTGTFYFAIRMSATTFKVAKTRAKAIAGTAINLTTAGSGSITVVEVNRLLREVVKSDREAEWGRRRETFVDARTEDEQDDDTALIEKADEALEETGTQTSFELEAAEVEGMRYGVHYTVGDLVTVELLTGVSSVERLGAVKLAMSGSSGLVVQLIPGNPDAGNPMFGQAAIVRGLRRRLADAEREEG